MVYLFKGKFFVHYTRLNNRHPKFRQLCLNVSTTPLWQCGFRHCLPFSWITLRVKHGRHPIAIMGVVDMLKSKLVMTYFMFVLLRPRRNDREQL